MPRVLFIITEDWAFKSHRYHLAKTAQELGYTVGIVTKFSSYKEEFVRNKFYVYDWLFRRESLNPISEMKAIWQLIHYITEFKPDIVHSVALKPIIYAGLISSLFPRIVFVSAMGGTGFIFNSMSLKAKFLRYFIVLFFIIALWGKRKCLIMQNEDNIRAIENHKITNRKKIKLIRGSGVEVSIFKPLPLPGGTPVVALIGRMLWDKGVGEFVNVARKFKQKKINARFVLVGDVDRQNPNSLEPSIIEKWVEEGIVEHWPRKEQINIVLGKISIVCLPSYHEGLPKVLLEAASCERPIVSFDVPGCREITQNNINGFLVPFGDEIELSNAIQKLVLNRDLCIKFGKTGRRVVIKQFSDKIINSETIKVWNSMLNKNA